MTGRPSNRGSSTNSLTNVSLLHSTQTISGCHLVSNHWVPEVLFQVIKRLEHKANRPPSLSTEIKNGWSSTSTPSHALKPRTGTNIPLPRPSYFDLEKIERGMCEAAVWTIKLLQKGEHY
jgi:hypothetical protein